MYKNITKIALKGIALAMGVAIIVMSTLKTLDINAGGRHARHGVDCAGAR